MPKQHIFRLDIAMDHFFTMSILQSIGHLLDVGHDVFWRNSPTLWVKIAQGAHWSIIHDQKGNIVRYSIIEDPYDVRMYQADNSICCLALETFRITFCQCTIEHFNSSEIVEPNMLS